MFKKILITGGIGAIGSALCRALLEKEIEQLVVIDDLSSSQKEVNEDIIRNERVQLIEASILDEHALKKAFSENIECIFHLAAHFANQNSVEHPTEDTMVNSVGTIKLLELAVQHNIEKFVFASSSCVYGNSEHFDIHTNDFRLDTPYAINKLHGEYLVDFFHEYHGLNTTILRYFNSFGPGELPGQYRNVIPNFIALALEKKSLPITGTVAASRDFNFVDNTVQATLLAATVNKSKGQKYNIGSGQATAIGDIATHINTITNNPSGIEIQPQRKWDTVLHRCADISKTVEDLGYQPIIDLETQLKKTCDWIQQYTDMLAQK